jgi:protein CLEC16A
VSGDKDDSRCLHVTVLRPTSITGGPAASARPPPKPLLAARFVFDDHIRCMAARQRLVKGRLRARQRKMQMIARLLELPLDAATSQRSHTSLHTPVSNFRRANLNPSTTTTAPATAPIPGQARKWCVTDPEIGREATPQGPQ